MLNIAIGTREHWDKVKHLYPDYKFYHERLNYPKTADNVLLVLSKSALLSPLVCQHAEYIPEREYRRDTPTAIPVDVSKPKLTKLEFHVCHHCNLNCDSCNHFCNADTQPSYPDFDTVKQDLQRIRELYWGIGELCLVGGEPFLNPDLDKYCDMARELFPESDIVLITNGLLIPKMGNERFLKALERNEITLLISRYPATEKLLGRIKTVLDKYRINVQYTGKIETFTKKLTLEPTHNARWSYLTCHERECHYLENGKIYGCTLFGRTHVLNEHYGTSYPETGIDIYEQTDGWKLNRILETTFSHCSYCMLNYQTVPWKRGTTPQLNLWIGEKPDKILSINVLKNYLRGLIRTL